MVIGNYEIKNGAGLGAPTPSKFYKLPRSAQAKMTIMMMMKVRDVDERLELHGHILAQLREQRIGRI